ncbi:MAG: hypothetical protein FH751_11340 [Firmicutes bacterium]|nr:hypothetical protein [Bacillota bacterium]
MLGHRQKGDDIVEKIGIFLGAGASKAEGAPLQNEIFYEYFSSEDFNNSYDEMDRELATFFYDFFNIDLDNDSLENVVFPTFEEALGLIDLAIRRKESFVGFDIVNRASNSGRLRFISQYLVFLIAKLLNKKLKKSNNLHDQLVERLYYLNIIKDTFFISTNYDILIDNALVKLYNKDIYLDYGIDFKNYDQENDWQRPVFDKSVHLFKPHGSLNWLYCPTCNQIEITPREKGVTTRLINEFHRATCKKCHTVYRPIIIPPSFYKDMSNVFIETIWNKAEYYLKQVNHLIFCGYSFPDADIHIKYLLKRIQINSDHPIKITVINYYDGKSDTSCKEEEIRYKRFFGQKIYYEKMSFESFVKEPEKILGSDCC